ncbi:MAG: AbrB/MazE/SpoVT family DNA-binding domain-containing protein [Clostridiales bacterium]|jgi:AbrB family looped-hinge helix DNA binding protein|nr:AbrB/MazE/SpoVT family DNA-binding domain-containing protein [Clostridiales bacterium]
MQDETDMLVGGAKVMQKGQITIPKDFRDSLGIKTGDKLILIYDGEKIVLIKASDYAAKVLQGDASDADGSKMYSDEDVADILMQMRYGKFGGK